MFLTTMNIHYKRLLIFFWVFFFFPLGASAQDFQLIRMNQLLDRAVYFGNRGRLLEAEEKYKEALDSFIRASSLVDSSLGLAERRDMPIQEVPWRAFMISGFAHYDAAQMHVFLDHKWLPILHQFHLSERAFNDIINRELAVEEEGGIRIPAPILSEIYYLLGNIHSFHGRIESARNAYRSSLSLNPRFFPARDSLAALDLFTGRFDHYQTSYGVPLPPCSPGQNLRDYYKQVNIIIAPKAREDSIEIYNNFHSRSIHLKKKK